MKKIKCLVWDLDDTMWDGVVAEGDPGHPRPSAVAALRELDRRGILHAVASRNDHDLAVGHLTRHGLSDLFSAFEIGWGAKSGAVRRVAAALGIGLDTVAFVDNDELELAEVAAGCPGVRCYPSARIPELADLAEFRPDFITEESGARRHMYRAERDREAAEHDFAGTSTEFLSSLDLVMTIRRAAEDDLARAHELTERTNQLNTTGLTFDAQTLRGLTRSPSHEVLVASLADRFGGYGTIGLAVTELTPSTATLRLLLVSCRVMSRGAGAVFLGHVIRAARARGLRPSAWYVPSGVNRIMLVTLRFAGFEVVAEQDDGRVLLAYGDDRPVPPPPAHVQLITDLGATT